MPNLLTYSYEIYKRIKSFILKMIANLIVDDANI